MHLSRFLEREIRECRRRLKALALQLKVDRDYVAAADAIPHELEYCRCQIELNAIEEDYLERRLAALRRWTK